MKKPSKPLEYALKLLGQRSYSEKKLREKLARREIQTGEIERVLVKLKELGFIDDYKFACAFIESAQNIRLTGQRKIYWQLIKKGISTEVAKEALEKSYQRESEEEVVRQIIKKLAPHVPPEKLYERLTRRLLARGFDYQIVKAEVKRYLRG